LWRMRFRVWSWPRIQARGHDDICEPGAPGRPGALAAGCRYWFGAVRAGCGVRPGGARRRRRGGRADRAGGALAFGAPGRRVGRGPGASGVQRCGAHPAGGAGAEGIAGVVAGAAPG
jgi:hypothetical protein